MTDEPKGTDQPWGRCLFCSEPGTDRYVETELHKGTAHGRCLDSWLDMAPARAGARWAMISARMRSGLV